MTASEPDEAVRRPGGPGLVERASRIADATPLRVKLVSVLLVLVTLALAASGGVAAAALQSYLEDRLDAELQATALDVKRRLDHEHGAGDAPPERFAVSPNVFLRVSGDDGTILGDSYIVGPAEIPALPAVDRGTARQRALQPFTVDSVGGDRNWRAVIVPLRNERSLVVALSLEDVRNTVSRLALLEVAIGLLVLLALGWVAYALVGSSLRPLVEVEETAAAIAAGDLSRRVPEQHPGTEVGRLGRALNGMLQQIESAFHSRETSEAAARASEERMRRFVADASHELRTPLTSIRGFAELYRQGAARSDADIGRSFRRIEDEAARMGLLVDDLLLLARLDQQRPLERRPVDLVAIAADAVADARVVAPQRPIALAVRDGSPAQVLGDEPRLRQVVGNLMSNALTHTPEGTAVKVAVGVAEDDGVAILSVADAGPGLAPEDAARVFERFYRVDKSRTRAAGGSGLGLSIVAALVAAHGGQVEVESVPGQGSAFTVRLPLWRDPDGAAAQEVGRVVGSEHVEAS